MDVARFFSALGAKAVPFCKQRHESDGKDKVENGDDAVACGEVVGPRIHKCGVEVKGHACGIRRAARKYEGIQSFFAGGNSVGGAMVAICPFFANFEAKVVLSVHVVARPYRVRRLCWG